MTRGKPKVLILTYTDFSREPRALKQARYLRIQNDVTTAGFGPSELDDTRHVELSGGARQRWGIFGRLLYFGLLAIRAHSVIGRVSSIDREVVRLLGEENWDVIIAHDLWSLAAARRLGDPRRVVLDLHEYAPSEGEQSFVWRLVMAPYVRWMLRVLVPDLAVVVTVSQGIADEYRTRFGFDALVVANATPFHELQPGMVTEPIRLVHSGAGLVDRGVGLIIEAVRSVSANVTLDLYLVEAAPGQIDILRGLAKGDERIHFRDPVPYRELISTLNTYDVGIHLLPPLNFNHVWALPNKFFDFVQARLGIIIGPSPEMARYVEEYGMGLVLPDFDPSSLAESLEQLLPAWVEEWKSASHDHAVALSSERQVEVWGRIIVDVVGADFQVER